MMRANVIKKKKVGVGIQSAEQRNRSPRLKAKRAMMAVNWLVQGTIIDNKNWRTLICWLSLWREAKMYGLRASYLPSRSNLIYPPSGLKQMLYLTPDDQVPTWRSHYRKSQRINPLNKSVRQLSLIPQKSYSVVESTGTQSSNFCKT